jgi:hypothetical protein
MNKLMIAFAATMTLMSFGCKKKSESGSSGAAMAKMSEFKDQMCACKDAECAKKVSDDMTTWSQEQAKNAKEPVKMSEADQKRATEIGTQMGECMQKAMGMGGTAPAGDGTAPAGDGTAPAADGTAPAAGDGAAPAAGDGAAAPAAPAGEAAPAAPAE